MGVAGAALVGVVGPALVEHDRADDGDVDVVCQVLEGEHDQRAMRPGTCQGDVEVIAAGFGGETTPAGWAGAAIRGYPVAKPGVLPDKAPASTNIPMPISPSLDVIAGCAR
jgi:hypothetical protein